ncbi:MULTISPECIES: hypothetical protein [Vibrio]|uniref:Uncharacterized protein n=2 Tax=Vibrio TaxID=662 RepID=A0A7X4LJ92_9VIBR|nr:MULTISPECIES: hypothetical protein [Vibrio]MBF9002852.1 hypothetical protein [Vibrio nitrifigilis]MZI92927.1 hypothetical protein [Vibrio eleionomae]
MNLLVFTFLVCLYFHLNNSDTPPKEAYSAMIFMGFYLVVFTFIPPFPDIRSTYMSALYQGVPMLSFGAVLFPHLNRTSPEVVTRVLGWSGMVLVFVILVIFKLVVW